MPIVINPSKVIAYPQDAVALTLQATSPPALWCDYGFFTMNADRSVRVNNNSDGIRGGLQLRSGSGSVEWTLDAQSLPDTPESLGFGLGVNATGTGIGDFLEIRFSATQFKLYNGGGLIAGTTTTYSAASGDRIKLEVYGSTIRVFINEVLKCTQVYSSTNPYPARYAAYIFDDLISHPSGNHLLPPKLVGDWQTTEEFLNWNVPATLGTYTVSTQRYVATVTITGNPGSYIVTGVVGASSHFTANAGTDQLTLTGSYHTFAVNDTVRIGVLPGGTLPTPLDFETVYYVKTYSGGVLTLSLTLGGALLNITAAGTGGWIERSTELLLQYANAEIMVPPFDVIGLPADSNVALDPSATRRWATTYDLAQQASATNFITRTVVTGGGGSFDGSGLYTAPATAGTYTLRFESNSQRRDFTVTVPATLTPANVRAAAPSEQITFTTTLGGTKTWSVSGGSLDTTSGATVIWTAPTSIGQVVRIQVTNGTTTLYQDVEILEALPVSISLPNPFETGPNVILEYADDDRTPHSRTLSESNFIPATWELQSNGLTPAETLALIAFNDVYLRAARRFFYTNHVMSSAREVVRFDSKIKGEPVGDCMFNLSFRVRRA